jgi:UDP-N-acetylmuramoylalanine--D-glutamate ligase
MRFEDLKDRRVAILGLGREGQAVWRQIRKRFPDQKISFFAETQSLDGFAKQLNPQLDDVFIGPFTRAQLSPFDVIIRSAGISPYREVLSELTALGVGFTTANSLWFAEHPDAKTICITGTKGKSTTASLTAHLIDCAGARVCLAGNIGRPMLDCEDQKPDWWVIELSSYQLSDLEAKPDIALLLNLSEEHIDWHGSVEQYRRDKLKLALLVNSGGLIVNASDEALVASLKHFGDFSRADYKDINWFNGQVGWIAGNNSVKFVPVAGLSASQEIHASESLPGAHNMQNLAAALTILESTGLKLQDVDAALASFTGLPHRLERIGSLDGVSYVDDSISTTPVSVSAALNTLGADNTVLLLGGLDRGLGWDQFAVKLKGNEPHAIITLPDNGPVIMAALESAGVLPVAGLHQVEDLQHAVRLAQQLVPENGCVLLSPGAPSFPHFRDYEDRGNQFARFAGIEKTTKRTH